MNPDRLHRLTKDWIAIPSVSETEHQLCLALEDELQRRGWWVRRQEVAEGRVNLLATAGEAPPRVLFNTHLDTVPGVYGPDEDSERIYGRGACDAKGILAAMLEALQQAKDRGREDLGLLLVVGEEKDHCGARVAGGDPQLPCPEVLVVGEPTDNAFMRAEKGVLAGRLRARGREGHSGYPERCDSAVEKLLDAAQSLRQAPWLADASDRGTTLNLSLLEGGDAYNKVPRQASLALMFRLDQPAEQIRRRTEAVLAPWAPEVRVEWSLESAADPLHDLDTLAGHRHGVAAFHTDLSHFGWQARRRYLVGPGSIHQAHRDLVGGDRMAAEWISKASLETGARLYAHILEKETAPC
ncbi:MAG: M20/M25/M40 family metallo-hydrolase [Planctomycetota bacterium]|nr:MAG: M20/M25/M40 family metallo-hydrolase [Planctomycetota bacterium]